MASSLPHNGERRAAGVRRVPVERIVDVCAASAASAPAFQGWSVNVSGRGMSVRAAHMPELATPLVVRFQEHGSEVIAEAVVVWRKETARGSEFGVRFTALDSRSVQALKELCQSATLRSVASEPPPGVFDVPDEPRAEEHDTEPVPPASSSVKLHIEGMAAPMQAQVRQQGDSRLALGSQLEFLRVGRNVEVEDVSLGDRRAACIDAVDVSIDPESRVPELVVSLRYDAAAPASSGKAAASKKAEPSQPAASVSPAAASQPAASVGPAASKPAANPRWSPSSFELASKPAPASEPASASMATTPPMPSGANLHLSPASVRTPSASSVLAPASSRLPASKGPVAAASNREPAAPASSKPVAPASSQPSTPASCNPVASDAAPTLVSPRTDAAEAATAAPDSTSAPSTEPSAAPPASSAGREPLIVDAASTLSKAPTASAACAVPAATDAEEADVPLDELGVPVDEEQEDVLSEPFRRLSAKALAANAEAEDEDEDELPPSRPSLEIDESEPSEAERLRQRLDGVLDNLSAAARVAGERCRSFGAAASDGARSVAEKARRAGQRALSQRSALPRRRTAAAPRSLRNTGAKTLFRSPSAGGSGDAAARSRVSQRALLGASLLGVVLVGTWLGLGRGSADAGESLKPAAAAAVAQPPAPVEATPVETTPAPSQRPRVLLPAEENEPEEAAPAMVAQVPLFGPTASESAAPESPSAPRSALEKIEKRALARAKPARDDFEPAPKAAPKPAPRRKPSTPPEFRSGRLELPIVHRLRLDRPAENLRGERTATGFDVIVPGRKTMEPGNTIARRDHRIAKVTTKNGSEGTRISFRFRSNVPAYKVRLRNDYIEFFISSD